MAIAIVGGLSHLKLQPFVHHPLNARLLFEDVLLSYRDLLQPHAVAPA